MPDHDPMCPSTGMAMPFGFVPVMPCLCAFIARVDSRVRADERERIAAAIETTPEEDWEGGWRDVVAVAARIARNGGSDA